MPYDPWRDEVVLIEQFRIGAFVAGQHPWLIEVVAGRIDAGESPEDVARREAVEEIGRPVDRLERNGRITWSILLAPTETNTTFVGRVDASDAGGVHGLQHEGEDIRVFTMPAEEVIGWIGTEKITNATFLIAMQFFAGNRQRLREIWAGLSQSGYDTRTDE